MGFLPNGDLIVVSLNKKLRDYKIYLYSFTNKPTNAILWEYSQIYDIKFNEFHADLGFKSFVRQTKLFLFNNGLLTQWDLLTMTIEIQYNNCERVTDLVINKNQTLLAVCYSELIDICDIYSMETGMHISRYG